MNTAQSKLNTLCFLVIAVCLVIIAYRQLQPNYIMTENGQIIDSRSGKFFQSAGGQLAPVKESMEEQLRREYPDGKKYQ